MEWKQIQGYSNYEVSDEGQIRNSKTGRVLKLRKNHSGYLRVGLHKNKKQKIHLVHRLVAEAWIPNPHNKPTVNHINENKEDNRVENLEWATYAEQNEHGTRTERTQKKVRCVETGTVYDGVRDAERQTNILHSSISKACQGKYKTAGGYHWEYVD